MTALLRAVRKQRGLTLEALAVQTGLTKSYLSKIERRQATPSIAVALKVAKALDVDVGRLFSDDAPEEKITVDRAPLGAEGQRYRPLASSMLGKSMSPFVVRPTEQLTDASHVEHSGQEFLFVHAGIVELDYGDQTITLGPGDSAYFDAAVSHKIRPVGDVPPQVVVVTAGDGG